MINELVNTLTSQVAESLLNKMASFAMENQIFQDSTLEL